MPKDLDIKRFTGGMNKDLDYSVLGDNQYIHAENFKLIADEDSNSLILENAEGNTEVLDLRNLTGPGYYIAGYSFIQPYLVIFCTEIFADRDPVDGDGLGRIIRVTIDRDVIQHSEVIYQDSGAKGYLNLSVTNPIKTQAYYESDDNIKVYWVDGYNEDRFMNIMDPDLNNQNVSEFSLTPDFPDVSDHRVEFVELTDGNINASKVQYTYQYYNTNGSSTRYAPVSPLIAVGQGSPNRNYKGVGEGVNTNNGCKIKVTVPTTKIFNRMRFVALDYTNDIDVPSVRVFSEVEVDLADTTTEVYAIDIGNTVGEIVYEDFLTYGSTTYKSKDLAVKDNILFKANIEESLFDVDFDARVYRFDTTPNARVYDLDLVNYYDITAVGAWTYSGGGSGTAWTIPDNADCINLFNDVDYEGNASYQYKYQDDGATFGATGPNIEISFDVATLGNVDTVGVGGAFNRQISHATGSNPSDPINIINYNSFQRHEVYRLGIVFFNEKMQSSSVKWMCDLKMPNHEDNSGAWDFITTSGTNTSVKGLGVDINMTGAMPTGAYAWQVVMVKRDDDDKSVLANGILQALNTATVGGLSVTYPSRGSAGLTYSELLPSSYFYTVTNADTKMFISPEINYGNSIEFNEGDFLQYNGYFYYDPSVGANPNSSQIASANWAAHKLNTFTPGGGNYAATTKDPLEDFQIIEQSPNEDLRYYIGNSIYSNYVDLSGKLYPGLHGTIGLTDATLSSTFAPPNNANAVVYVSYRRNNFESQYGGVSYYDRQRNEYYGISGLVYTNTAIATHEGDINIDFFDYHKQAIDLTDSNSWFGQLFFPVESSDVMGLREDTLYGSNDAILTREQAGVYDDGTYHLPQALDLYTYNSVYSVYDSSQKYLDVLLDESDQSYFPIRVRYSDTKLSGELQDSFTIFRSNNFRDVDGRYGEVNNLLTFKNQLYFWQNSAFGILSVNQRSLITDNNPGILSLGDGGVLSRYDYLSNTVGNTNDYGIVNTNKYIYWVDNSKSEFYKYDGNDVSISKVAGIQTWINDNGFIGWVKGIYDAKYNAVIFTLSFARPITSKDVSMNMNLDNGLEGLVADGTRYNSILHARLPNNTTNIINKTHNVFSYTGGEWQFDEVPDGTTGSDYYVTIVDDPTHTFTITYSERANAFTSFNSFDPTNMMQLNNVYMTSADYYSLYMHNVEKADAVNYVNRCQYYGSYYDSVITTVFNKDFPYTKVFDVVKWNSEAEDKDGINIFKETFDKAEFYTDYQHTGDRDLYYQHDAAPATRPTPISRRERTWSMAVPRDIVDDLVENNPDITDPANWDETNGRNTRIRDKYMVGSFTYENDANNYTFSVPFISTIFRRSYR